MIPTIRPTLYKDQLAITLESETIAAQFLPGVGAKLCSLIYKPANLELLLQRPAEKYLLAPYDGGYVTEGECSGFDEMFPSIDKSFYEGYPWQRHANSGPRRSVEHPLGMHDCKTRPGLRKRPGL